MSNDDEKNGNIDRNKLLIVGGAVLAAVAAVGAYFLFGNNSTKSGSGTSLGTEQTLAIIKPDGIQYSTQIREKIAQSGFTILQSRKITLTKEMAGLFYNEHRNKKFFEKLTDYMTSGPVLVMKLEKDNAIAGWRDLMGPTDPNEARKDAPQSIRAKYGKNLDANVVHGSDSQQAAQREIGFFFDD